MVNSLNQKIRKVIGCCMLINLFLSLQANDSSDTIKEAYLHNDHLRFESTVLIQDNLDEPLVFEVLGDGRVFLIERKGIIKLYQPTDASVRIIGFLEVNTSGNEEQGLVGMTLDPDFRENGWMYLYYFHPNQAKAIISRWDILDDTLMADSEKILLEFPAQRETCCHTGGGMTWDKDDNLYIATGNNTGINETSHTDERPGRSSWDGQRGASNTDSLEGKILRIHPEANGSYSIPHGNLFPLTTPLTLPEIYTMGHLNACRVSIDSATGYLYWGETGPERSEDSRLGPKGFDEFNQARGPGFFGWPYFTGDAGYAVMDYETNTPGEIKNPKSPTNLSPNNTGMTELPPVSPSFINYSHDQNERFPSMGTGERFATGGPVYRRADYPNAKRPWPDYFEGKWLAAEFSRKAIFLISMDPKGNAQSLERFLPGYHPAGPIDMKFAPDGNLYILEHGERRLQSNSGAKLVRIIYDGNSHPKF